jgi:leucyl-tRNA synthetase
MEYNFRETEQKWQKYWAEKKTFKAKNISDKPKYYVLDMFPYPSGAGLHVGHPLGYIASDIFARYKRLKGFNVLHPMGYDSFGLPAEQYAIQTGQHPEITTKTNIARYREQLDKIGFSFDWDREVRTSNPEYYKWTQWIFIQLFNSWYNPETNKAENISTLIEKFRNGSLSFGEGWGEAFDNLSEKEQSEILLEYRLAFLSDTMVNWCPQLGTVLANEEVKDGVSERGGYPVERKLMKQWSLRITTYAERLLNDLDGIDWTESIKEAQRNWIGRSEGTSLRFSLTPTPSPKQRGTQPGYQTANKKFWEQLKDYSKENRQNPTEAELLLWEKVRDNRLGFKIRRQHAIGQFIADFVCLDKKLIIEVDGEIHNHQQDYDEGRTYLLEELGYNVIRFSNETIKEKIDWACTEIINALNTPLSFGEGAGGEAFIEVFTTRPDTIFGVSFVTLAPEHELVAQLTTAEQKNAVEEYIVFAKNRSERERMADVKKITGVFTGSYVIHPFTGKQIPIWIGDYVLAGYGTGAVMAVPAHDSRDYAFAKHFGLDIIKVIEPNGSPSLEEKGLGDEASYDAKEGKLINSDFLNGLEVKAAMKKAIAAIEEKGLGKGKINYRLRDAIFGRQRYWGEPIPVYYKNGIPHVLNENELPLLLPEVDKYLPTEDGEPPLARAKEWAYTPSPSERGLGGEAYPYEHSTMPGWAGSSWYYLRYMDAHNDTALASKQAIDYWQNIDLYIGGSEHATGHLLYVRFWTKFLYDLGIISFQEPAKKLINQGMIQGRSNFVYRLSWSGAMDSDRAFVSPNIFISKNIHEKFLANDSETVKLITNFAKKMLPDNGNGLPFPSSSTSLHVDVNIVYNDILDTEAFKKWREEYKDAVFITEENDDYICGHEVEKMSKSKWNVVSPDLMVEQYGADCLRLYEMFLGPLELSKPWNTNGITGVSNFIRKLWRLYHSADWNVSPLLRRGAGGEVFSDEPATKAELKVLHKTIKKIITDIEGFSFNTSVSNFMICVNELTELKCNKREVLEPLAIIIAPYAPHIAEELWSKLGHTESITYAQFPECKEEYLIENTFSYPVSFNGKTRFFHELERSIPKEDVEKLVLELEQTQKYLEGKAPKKVIVVPNKIVNIVI